MRAEEGDESIAELAKDAAKADEKLDEAVDVDGSEHKGKHRKD